MPLFPILFLPFRMRCAKGCFQTVPDFILFTEKKKLEKRRLQPHRKEDKAETKTAERLKASKMGGGRV